MTVLHWVRHGPTHARTMIGWTDLPADLSDRARVARLSAHLPAAARLVSSDLCRAVATADALSGAARQRLPHEPDLREIHFGAWENRSFAEIEAEEPEAIAAFWQRPGPSHATGGECWDALSARVSAAADRLAALGGEIIVVAHFGAILTQIERARGIAAPEVFAQKIEPLSVTSLHLGASGWEELSANHQP
ncbi:histidine phosphatase family protein [Poseidonocella sp. HB161398]|uniref:histidine phosphatase family protein n=1 Tax=Poseidonocella sp. HB161398 TaxID=2320855 RepID=UPI0011090523|nr:histidine phosphatase family protein [Poseidonocella sp. HB161398]